MTLDTDRVRRHTAKSALRCIDDDTAARLLAVAESSPDPHEHEARLRDLEREWDTDRVIETEAALNGLAGLLFGMLVHSRALALPGIVASMVFLYAVTGRYPLLPLLRRLGVRTAREIARERYAVKALRGDFAELVKGATGVRRTPTGQTAVDERISPSSARRPGTH
jgi:hypothetical protein